MFNSRILVSQTVNWNISYLDTKGFTTMFPAVKAQAHCLVSDKCQIHVVRDIRKRLVIQNSFL